MLQGGLLALDIGTRTGWVYGLVGDAHPIHGFWTMPEGESAGTRGMRFQNALAAKLEEHRPRALVYAVRIPKFQTSAYLLTGLAFCAEVEAVRASVRHEVVREDTARKHFTGRGNWCDYDHGKAIKGTGTKKAKAAVERWCESRGWYPQNHDVADALLIWAYQDEREVARARMRSLAA